jgi:hypothetical protein
LRYSRLKIGDGRMRRGRFEIVGAVAFDNLVVKF